jgi:hypothetical protein
MRSLRRDLRGTATIGVEPLHCVGLDSALLADTLRRCDQEHLPGLSGIQQPRQHCVARRIGQVDWKSAVPIAALRYHGSVLLHPLTSGLGAKLGKAEQGRDQDGWQYVAPCQAEARRDDDGFQSGRDCEKS